jgi:hypothetical protein
MGQDRRYYVDRANELVRAVLLDGHAPYLREEFSSGCDPEHNPCDVERQQV